MKRTALALLFCVPFLVAGCFEDNIKTVKNSTFPGYETVKIGKILFTQFDKPSWEEFESDQGETIVEFKGEITQALHDRAVGYAIEQIYAEITGALLSGEGLQFQMMALQLDKLIKSFDPNLEKQLVPRLVEAGIPKEAANIAPLLIVLDQSAWISGEKITIQWIKEVTSGEFRLQYMGGSEIENLEEEDVLSIIFDGAVEYEIPALADAVEKQLKPLFENWRNILAIYAEMGLSQ